MKKFMKLFAMLLAIVMVISLFAGCGNSGNNGNDGNNGNNVNDNGNDGNTGNDGDNSDNGDDGDDEPVLDARTPKEIEMERDTVVIVGIDQPQFNPDDERPVVWEFFQENYGGNIEQIVTGNAEFYTKTASLIMAGESPDMVGANGMFPQLVIQDVIQSVDHVLTITEPVFAHLEGAWELYKFGGEHYMLPWLVMHNDDVFYNKQMMNEAALDDPFELWDKGEWDWDVFRDYAIELTQDVDGDGATDIHGIGFTGWHESLFVHSAGVTLAEFNDDGTITSNLKNPDLARAFNFLVDLFKVDEVAVLGGMDLLDNGQVAMYQGPFFWSNQAPSLTEGNILGRVPIPKDPEADDYYQSGVVLGWYMPKGADAPRLVEAFMYSCVLAMLPAEPGTDKYEEDLAFSMSNLPTWSREEVIAWQENYERFQKEIIPVVDMVSIGGQVDVQAIFSRMYNLDTPYATVVEELEPIFEGFIDEMMSSQE